MPVPLVDARVDRHRALALAAQLGQTDVVRLLVERGARLSDGLTALKEGYNNSIPTLHEDGYGLPREGSVTGPVTTIFSPMTGLRQRFCRSAESRRRSSSG
jgi:hypothetical protein